MPTQKKKIQQGLEERNPGGGGGGGGSTSSTSPPHGPPPPPADRISELPVEILHRILGFLEMDEFLIRTSLVSTKWRNLWKSVSVLKFTRCRANDSGCACVLKYQNFVDHVLRLRDSQASKIQIFRYCCYNINNSRRRRRRGGGYDDLERLHKLIVSAVVNQGAQEIQITGASYLCRRSNGNNMKMIHFNPSIFTSGELRKFTFQVFNDHFRIQFPRSMCCSATQLTHLNLSEIRLPEGGDDAQLHLVCPVLEELLISDCYAEHLKVLDVSAPRLNDLAIYNTAGSGSEYLGECRIEIRTPNLTRLFYYGFVYVDCFTENLPYLESANLNFSQETGMVEKTTLFATKLLKGLTSAQTLTLQGFEVLSQDTSKVLLKKFTSLRTLELKSNCKISSIHGMVHILNSCNSIEKFAWEVDEYVEVEGDEHLMLSQCKLSHLKHVCIEYLRGHENEIEFVKFLLNSSVVLEDLIIKTTENSPKQTIEENLKQFIEEEPSFRSIKLQIL